MPEWLQETVFWVAIIGLLGTIVQLVVERRKRDAESKKTSQEGDSSLMSASSLILKESGEFGVRLMERIASLEAALDIEREERGKLQGQVNDLRVALAKKEATIEVLTEVRDELLGERNLRVKAEQQLILVRGELLAREGELEALRSAIGQTNNESD